MGLGAVGPGSTWARGPRGLRCDGLTIPRAFGSASGRFGIAREHGGGLRGGRRFNPRLVFRRPDNAGTGQGRPAPRITTPGRHPPETLTWLPPRLIWTAGRSSLRTWASVRSEDR